MAITIDEVRDVLQSLADKYPVPEPAEVADALDSAYDTLLVEGWTQASSGHGENGERCLMTSLPRHGHRLGEGSPTTYARYTLAYVLFNRPVGPKAMHYVVDWNDHPDRTVDDVLDLLRRSAKALRNGEIDLNNIKEQ